MNVTRKAPNEFVLEFDDEQEVREEHRINLAHGALRLPTAEVVPLYTTLAITLRGPWGGEANVRGTVVAALPDGLAVGIEGDGDAILAGLLSQPVTPGAPSDDRGDRKQSGWDRIRALSQMEKILLAVKAESSERAVLLQENDPRILLSLLRNPSITVDEVARMTRSSFLNYQVADVIMKSAQWSGNLDVRLGLIHNAKTPQAFALRILPTLPESEVRAIARAGTSMALKQAALRRLQDKR
ncbi:MAG: hypothetical protein ACYC7A_14420 [Thermoanaerobaculia bacterium]